MTSIQDIGLLAEEGVPLIIEILHNLWTSSPILHSEGVFCHVSSNLTVAIEIVSMTQAVIVLELTHAVLPVRSVSRLAVLLDDEIARNHATRWHVIQAALMNQLPIPCMVIYRAQIVHLVGLRGAH